MDWPSYNQDCADLHLEIARHVPDALIRFDFLAEGWGCSVTPTAGWEFDGTETVEVYGEGPHPQAAMQAALVQLELLAVVG